MRYRVELRRAAVDGGSRIREAMLFDAFDVVCAAEYARHTVAGMYDEPECYWIVEAVVPVDGAQPG